jgi:hypothetical protein
MVCAINHKCVCAGGDKMKNEISQGFKATFATHALFSAIFGLCYLLIPEAIGEWTAWDMSDVTYRIIGAFGVALAISSAMAALAHEWREVRIKVALEMSWALLAEIVMVWAMLAGQMPPSAWVFIIAFPIWFSLYGYFAYVGRQRETQMLRPSH